MKKIKEIGIPIFIWLFFIPQSIIAGFDFASLNIDPNDEMPLNFMVLIISLSFCMGFFITLVNYLRNKMKFEVLLEGLLTKDSYKIIGKRLKPYLLGSLSFGLFGISGLVNCYASNSPLINKQILLSPLSMGAGIFLGGIVSMYVIKKRQLNK